jgi:hypothetical protein
MELVQIGYEVALAEPLTDLWVLLRRPSAHDLKLLRATYSWLGRDGILYCGHNFLYFLPLLRSLGLIRCQVVAHLWAREPLQMALGHTGLVALTPTGAEHAHKLAPHARVVHLGWGVDLDFFPELPYDPQWFLSCGKTHRDHRTLSSAVFKCGHPTRVICPELPPGLPWPPSVQLITGGQADDTISYRELLHEYYSRCAASLIVLESDPEQETAVGFTNLIEALAMARPVIVTQTGALPSEIDVEKTRCGLLVPPGDPEALAKAITALAADPARAEAMGRAGRRLAEEHYNIRRYGRDLHKFFESL